MGFRQYQAIDLAAWTGGKRIARLPDLLNAVETVARTGPGASGTAAVEPRPLPRQPKQVARSEVPPVRVSRRLLVGGGAAAAAAALAGAGIWWSVQQREDPRVEAAIDKAESAIRHQTADEQTVRALQQAVSIAPNSARVLGLLALVQSLNVGDTGTRNTNIVEDAENTAQKALSLDPKEANALLALFELQGSSLDWFTRDQKLRQIITLDPKNVTGLAELVLLTQATGLTQKSWDWNERALAHEPLSADYLTKRALKLFIWGRVGEADKIIDQVVALYPANPWPSWARFFIYAFSGRARAALAFLNAGKDIGSPSSARFWRQSLPALEQPSPPAIAKARDAAIQAAAISARGANESVLVMSALGELDTAFDIANGSLLSIGSMVPQAQTDSAAAGWRISTQWMWTPPGAPMRRDPRFLRLCAGIGLVDYWRKRGVKPDYQRA